MDWLLKVFVVWFCIDIVTVATGWYLGNTIMVRFPNWWRQNICDNKVEFKPGLGASASSVSVTISNRHL